MFISGGGPGFQGHLLIPNYWILIKSCHKKIVYSIRCTIIHGEVKYFRKTQFKEFDEILQVTALSQNSVGWKYVQMGKVNGRTMFNFSGDKTLLELHFKSCWLVASWAAYVMVSPFFAFQLAREREKTCLCFKTVLDEQSVSKTVFSFFASCP